MRTWVHQFVVFRIDAKGPPDCGLDARIRLKSVWDDEAEARAQVQRLTELNHKGCTYYVQPVKRYTS